MHGPSDWDLTDVTPAMNDNIATGAWIGAAVGAVPGIGMYAYNHSKKNTVGSNDAAVFCALAFFALFLGFCGYLSSDWNPYGILVGLSILGGTAVIGTVLFGSVYGIGCLCGMGARRQVHGTYMSSAECAAIDTPSKEVALSPDKRISFNRWKTANGGSAPSGRRLTSSDIVPTTRYRHRPAL